jgi:hypothetical protein
MMANIQRPLRILYGHSGELRIEVTPEVSHTGLRDSYSRRDVRTRRDWMRCGFRVDCH